MNILTKQFLLGLKAGWDEMMSPFKGLSQAIQQLWHGRVGQSSVRHHT